MVADEPEPGFRYWAFISYSHQDKAWGRWLHRALETYRLPQRLIGMPIAAGIIPARLTPVFRDRDELPTATDLDRTVAEALRQSWCLIVICSPASAQSRWVNEEVREFQKLGRAERIHCLVVDGSTAATAAPCFPPALRERPWLGTVAGEPIAADARRSGDGKANARLKLVAGILGVSFDKLVQRDQQRGYRRMATIAAAAVLALVLLTVFTVVTVTSRRDAEAQRSHAEGLVEFMLGDLRQKLEPEGKLSTLDAVGKEALAYYAAQDPASLDADALARRARALHLIGEVKDQRGEIDSALGVFKQAADSTAELLARDPANAQRIFDHAQSVYWVGHIAWQRGDLADAENAFKRYKEFADNLVAKDSAKDEWLTEAEYADSNLGTLLLAQGRAGEAQSAFMRAIRVAQTLALKAPHDEKRQIELAQAHAWLASSMVRLGDLANAMEHRQAEVSVYEAILSINPRDLEVRNALAIAERVLGELSLARGDIALAVGQSKRAANLASELLDANPEDVDIAAAAAKTYSSLGEADHYAGDDASAGGAIDRARLIAMRLVAKDPTIVTWQTLLARNALLEARLLSARAQTLDAFRMVQGVLQQLASLSTKRGDSGIRAQRAEALLMSAELKERLGNAGDAELDWQRASALFDGDKQAIEPRSLAVLAIVSQKLGRTEEANAHVAALAAMGYRGPHVMRDPVIGKPPRARELAHSSESPQ